MKSELGHSLTMNVLPKGAQEYVGGEEVRDDEVHDENEADQVHNEQRGMELMINDFDTL